ncbi:hypothetical protein D018_1386A, partial [Vibrio parahaemolyticus VP2007-007]
MVRYGDMSRTQPYVA